MDFLEFENLGGSDSIFKRLRSGQKNRVFRGKSQDKISLCYFKMKICHRFTCGVSKYLAEKKSVSVSVRVDTKWRFQFFTKYDYRFLLDVIIAPFFAKAIIAISRLSLSISLE